MLGYGQTRTIWRVKWWFSTSGHASAFRGDAGSKPVPRQVVEWWADPESPYFRTDGEFGDFERRIITFCDGGGNGTFTAVTLQEMGYDNVATVEGGFYGWVAAGLPIVDHRG